LLSAKDHWKGLFAGLLILGLSPFAVSPVPAAEVRREESWRSPSALLLSRTEDPGLAGLLGEVLERNPEIAMLRAEARALEERPGQARSLPDPTVSFTGYVHGPETRVGPQRATATLAQRFPWFGKLTLREQAAEHAAAAGRARIEARKLGLLTEARILHAEIAFLDAHERITRVDRERLLHYQELARTRYAAGIGIQQAVVKIQADITKDDARLLEIARLRRGARISLNALRRRPASAELPAAAIPLLPEVVLDGATLRSLAEARRPEVAEAEAEIARAGALVKLARSDAAPEITVGVVYSFVDERSDPAGRMSPPEDNGQDVLGISAGVTLPIWRGRLASGVRAALEERTGVETKRLVAITEIHREVDDLHARIPFIRSQLRLFEEVLLLQAEESLRSAEAAYAAGTLDALALLDAERVLLEVRTAAERTRADYAVAVARLEGAVGGPLPGITMEDSGS